MKALRPLAAVLTLTTFALAGCSDGGGPATDAADDFQDLDLVATDETGVIRGVVIDASITPVPNADVAVERPGAEPLTALTGADGLFGFDGLAPGSYFVKVQKAGYFDAQQSVEVVPDVADPPAVRILLELNEATRPYVQTLVFEGFMECGLTSPAVGVSLCGLVNSVGEIGGAPNATNEDSQVRYPLDRAPTWTQSEMVWESTQAFGDELALLYSYGDCGEGFYCDHESRGTSPVLLTANATMSQTLFDEEAGELYIRVFTDDVDATAVPGYLSGSGITFEQSFTIYTHVFYGYQPPEGWRFSVDGEAPAPQ